MGRVIAPSKNLLDPYSVGRWIHAFREESCYITTNGTLTNGRNPQMGPKMKRRVLEASWIRRGATLPLQAAVDERPSGIFFANLRGYHPH